ncbi:MAG: RNA polymerase sigma factor [Phycisphaerales bacterium]
MPDPTARQLLLGTHRGDAEAAARLYRRFAPRMLAYARALLGRSARTGVADDAVQQAFVHVLAARAEVVERVEDELAWLIRLTRNAALNARRTQTRSALREKMRAGLERRTPSSAADGSLEELLAAVSTLEDDHRELLLLRHVAGLTFEQMALALEENRNTLATRYRAALVRLREMMPAKNPTRHAAATFRPTEVHHE